jgi:uncharacterized hydrophobic protein (TIGR00271 family)
MEKPEDDNSLDKKKEEVQKDFIGFYQSLKEYLPKLLSIRTGTDKEATAEIIRENISIKGQTAWILVLSILIASIGLNVSSTAVVIGAMLISPLMGPILGVGFSIAINDVDTLKGSLINFGAMVTLSILTSFLFFSIPIFKDATPEILSRTKPDVRDVLIAIAGGLALMIAISRPKPQFNTVAGVAIATALMPPLCTAGFGLATGQFKYFGGALFLFTINSIFIALAAFAITKYLKFPMLKYINQAKRKRISQMASLVALIIFSFSIYLFYELLVENRYKVKATEFINMVADEGINIIGEPSELIDYSQKEIKLYVFGPAFSRSEMERWNDELKKIGLGSTKLTILQSQDDSKVRNDIDELKNLYMNSNKMISAKDESIREKDIRISELEKDLRRYYNQEIPFDQISKEIKINYEHLLSAGFSREYVTDFKKMDTLSVITLKWDKKIRKREVKKQQERVKRWLEARLGIRNLEIRNVN